MVEAVQKQPFVAVIGASGSGKSSVVYAGLIPRLRRQGNWLITAFRPGQQPLYNLSVALIPLFEPDKSEVEKLEEINKLTNELRSGAITLTNVCEAIARKYPDSHLLLFVDQFEELYTLCSDDNERRRFLDKLLAICGSTPLTMTGHPERSRRVILTLRADFLGKALAYRPFADAFQNSDIVLGPMNRDELRAAIEEPAKTQHVQIEDGLTNRILDAVGDEPGNLPLLEFALTVLWNRQIAPPVLNQARGVLTHAAYDAIGGVEKALASYAEGVYNNLPQDEQERMQHIFTQLVRPGEGTEDTRRVATCSEIGADNWKFVTKLADARLVVTSSRSANFSLPEDQQTEVCTPEGTVEVAHETLITGWQRLREWMDKDREFRLWQERLRQALQEWEEAGKIEDLLLPEIKVSAAEAHLKDRLEEINARERTYIEKSRVLRQRERKKRELEEYTRRRHQQARRRSVVKNLLLGLAIFALLLRLQDTGWLQFTQNVVMDFCMQVFPGTTPNTVREIPPLVFLDIDEETYRDWGEPLLARDRLLQLLQVAVEGKARVIVLDIFFTQKTPGISGDNRDALHPDDQALYDYLAQYSETCRTNLTTQEDGVRCPQILLIRDVRWSQEQSCSEIRPSFLDAAVNNSPDIHWVTALANLESDRVLRRVRLWQVVCHTNGEKQVMPSAPLLATALQLGKDEQSLKLSQEQQRILYRIPWKRPAGQDVPFARFPAKIITQALDAKQPLDTTSLAGSIVLIGGSFGDAKDIYPTPLGESPGSLILLNAIYSLLQYVELRSLSVWLKLLIEIGLILCMSLLFIRLGILRVSLLTYVPVIVLMFWIYRDGMWVELDVVLPLFAIQLQQVVSELLMASEFKTLQEQFAVSGD